MLEHKSEILVSKQIAQQISAQGPITVQEYMRLANQAYYNSRDPFGKDGDFITAPEVSQMFGELIGLWLTDIWFRNNSPYNVNYVELGPGRGTLASDILRSANKFDFRPIPFFLETSETLRKAQSEAVQNVNFCENIDELPEDGPLFVIANEFFDALPIRQFISTHSGWRERVVSRDKGDKFIAMPGTSEMDGLIPNNFKTAPVDSIFETSPDTSNIIYELINRINDQGGVLLIIDYGYDDIGHGNTLQAVSKHRFADPFEKPGERDLSAHVNFMEIVNIANMRDMQVSGPIDQGDWLQNLGIHVRADNLILSEPERAEDINNARNRLIGEGEMGRLFKIVSIAHPEWRKGEGFESKIPNVELDESLI